MKCIPKAVTLIFVYLTALNSFAKDGGSSHELSVGAGMASPSETSALFENPAGLVYNSRIQFQGFGSSGNSSFNPLTAGAGIFLGNGMVGGAINATALTNNIGNTLSLQAGLAASIGGRIALGIEGSFLTSNSSAINQFDTNVGVIFNSHHDLRFGFAALGVVGGVDGYGAGIAYDLNSNATLAFDASTDSGLNTIGGKPALMIHLNPIQLTGGYAFTIKNAVASPLISGASVGVGINLSDKFKLQGYYNQLANYFFGLKVALN